MTVRRPLAAAIAVVLGLGLAGPAPAAERVVPRSHDQVRLSYAPVVRTAAPAVVNIYSRKVVQGRAASPLFRDPFFRRFFGDRFGLGAPRRRIENALGSGVIVDADGVIVTNHHVIAGAAEITVVLADRREFDATLVGSDERTDLAVLRIDTGGERLPHLDFRDSDDLEVGDVVLAIGNPFGVGQTVTSGIVSALARTGVGVTDFGFFIQTDAAINPGNSGGALVDIDGGLIGINTAIYSKSGGSLGIGFAVPSNMVSAVVAGFTAEGRLVRPWLGAWGQTVTSEIAQSLDMAKPAGVLVNDVHAGGPAARAGIAVGDVILGVDGFGIDGVEALNYRIATRPVGGTARIMLMRKGREQTVRLALEPPSEDPPRDTTELSGRQPLSGATVANMSPALAEELGVERFRPGVVVIGLRRGAPAARFGFRPGDGIEAVNGEAVASVAALKRAVAVPARVWRMTVRRGGKTVEFTIGG